MDEKAILILKNNKYSINKFKIIKYIEIKYKDYIYRRNEDFSIKTYTSSIYNNMETDDYKYFILKNKKINPINFPSTDRYDSESIVELKYSKINKDITINFVKKKFNDKTTEEVYISCNNISLSPEQIFQTVYPK